MIIFSISGTILLRYKGRRFIMIWTAILMGVSMGALAAQEYFFMDETDPHLRYILSLTSIVEMGIYIFGYGVGVGTIPWMLAGEICPIKVTIFVTILGNKM